MPTPKLNMSNQQFAERQKAAQQIKALQLLLHGQKELIPVPDQHPELLLKVIIIGVL